MTENVQAGIYGRQSRNKAKSIDEQITAGEGVARDNAWTVSGRYQDGSSASRYARKGRDDWQQVLDDIAAGAFTVLILWEASRGDRDLTNWSAMLDLCRKHGVTIYIIADERLYDPRKATDWKTLARAGVDSAGESDIISLRVRRGHAGAAAAGRPSHGRTPYGYVRRYDPKSGELVAQDPDPETAPVVRELFARLAKGETIAAIVRDFNDRDLPRAADAARWYPVRVRDLAMNRAYLGERTYNGTVSPGIWPPLVGAEQFYDVQRILTDPKRVTTRPGKGVHLLSYLATCHPCGSPLTAVRGRYKCNGRGCVTTVQYETDRFVEKMLFEKLGQPNVYEQLRQASAGTNQAADDAAKEIAQLTEDLKMWRLSGARRETSPASLAVIEADLEAQIRAAERRRTVAEIPPELREFVEPGVDIRVRWDAAPMAARRRVIAYMATVTVDRSPTPGGRTFHFTRLGKSRWTGDPQTWGEKWAAEGL
jgi:site-specific DNA recombinase